MDSIEADLHECRMLCELGQYAKAGEKLRFRLNTTKDLRLVADLGDVLSKQGYLQHALQALEEGLEKSTSPGDVELLRSQIQMHKCLLTPIVTGAFDQSLKHAEMLYQNFVARTDTPELERSSVTRTLVGRVSRFTYIAYRFASNHTIVDYYNSLTSSVRLGL